MGPLRRNFLCLTWIKSGRGRTRRKSYKIELLNHLHTDGVNLSGEMEGKTKISPWAGVSFVGTKDKGRRGKRKKRAEFKNIEADILRRGKEP